MGVFNESIIVKMEFEVTMGVAFGPVGPANIYTKYLHVQSSKLKTI